MAKYVDVQVPILPGSTATGPAKVVYTNSSTTTGAVDGKLTDGGGTPNFTANVQVGDYVFINATGISGFTIRYFSIVTAVDSDSALSISGRGNTGVTGLSASGTAYTIVAAANVYDCDLSGGGFIQVNRPSGVQVGDVWCNTTTNLNYRVTEVVSNTKIKLDTPGACIVGDDFFLLTDRAEGGNYKVRVDNATLIRGNASNGQTTVHYKRGSTSQKLAMDLCDAPSSAYDEFSTQFKKSAELVMQDSWRYASITMPYVPSDGTQGIQWIATFTYS